MGHTEQWRQCLAQGKIYIVYRQAVRNFSIELALGPVTNRQNVIQRRQHCYQPHSSNTAAEVVPARISRGDEGDSVVERRLLEPPAVAVSVLRTCKRTTKRMSRSGSI